MESRWVSKVVQLPHGLMQVMNARQTRQVIQLHLQGSRENDALPSLLMEAQRPHGLKPIANVQSMRDNLLYLP